MLRFLSSTICITCLAFLAHGLGELRGESVVRYSDFGAVGDGKTDDFEALAKAHDHANEKNLPVVADDDATYYIGGADRTIEVQTSTRFGKAKFIIDDTNVENHRASVFQVSSKQKTIRLKGVESLVRGQKSIDADLPGPCVVTARDAEIRRFIRRGKNQNNGSLQTDVFLVDGRGKVDPNTPIIWDFKTVNRLEATPVDEETLILRGGHFTTIAHSKESTDYHARGISIQRSNVLVEGLGHQVTGEGKDGPPYKGFISVSQCANVVVKDTVVTGRKTYYKIGNAGKRVPMGSYDISLTSALNVALINVTQTNDIMDRSRWGIIGTNFCKNLVYDGCKLSRFDAHQGVTNAAIRNSTLGYMGVKLTGFGNFLIENSTVHGREFIGLRPDYGSTWNGIITIRNCIFKPSGNSPSILSGSNDGQHDFGYTCHLPSRLLIDGLRIEDGNGGRGPTIFGNFNPKFKNSSYKEKFPYQITREVVHRGVTTQSGKPLRVSDNPHMFRGVEVREVE